MCPVRKLTVISVVHALIRAREVLFLEHVLGVKPLEGRAKLEAMAFGVGVLKHLGRWWQVGHLGS